MRLHDLPRLAATRFALGALVVAGAITGVFRLTGSDAVAGHAATEPAKPTQPTAAPDIVLTDSQLKSFTVGTVGSRVFPLQSESVGSIDFDQDMETQVFAPYQGRIVALFAKAGDDVKKGQPLFAIDSPDLVQAESTLIGTAGILRLTGRALDRAKDLYAVKGLAQKDYDQAISDQQGAEGNYKAAVDALRVFGKSMADIEKIVSTRSVDSILTIVSPIDGRVTVRNAAPGLLVQPGNAAAPFAVADISAMWMIGDVAEADIGMIRIGQPVKVSVLAYPDEVFGGTISNIAATVDPTLHTLQVRSDVADLAHRLRPGMLARFTVATAPPVTATAVPADAVVREGDGTMTVWVATNQHTFSQRAVRTGLRHDGYVQILDGLQQGEPIVAANAIFLDNMLTAGPTD